jgi:hypothetical protein
MENSILGASSSSSLTVSLTVTRMISPMIAISIQGLAKIAILTVFQTNAERIAISMEFWTIATSLRVSVLIVIQMGSPMNVSPIAI